MTTRRLHTKTKKSSDTWSFLNPASQTNAFDSRPFMTQAKTANNTHKPDLKTSLKQAEKYGHNPNQIQSADILSNATLLQPKMGMQHSQVIQAQVDESPLNQETAKNILGPHIANKKAEQDALGKWNPNALGRNQGLVHIIDYAYGRPPQNKELEEKTGGHPKSGEFLMNELNMEHQEFQKFAKKNLQEYKSEKTSQLLPVVNGRDQEGQIIKTNPQKSLDELQDIDKQRQEMMDKATNKKEVAQSEEYKNLGSQKLNKEQQKLKQTGFTVARDDSKKGRIGLVEQAVGKEPGSFKKDKQEITGVTNALDQLTVDKTKATTQGPTNESKTLPSQWVKGGKGSRWIQKGSRWVKGVSEWEQKDVNIQDQSISRTHQTTGDQPLKVVEWGPKQDQVKYSTVMGAPSEKKKKK